MLAEYFDVATGLDEVDALLWDGKAIKVYRERTGVDLKEAKQFIDRWLHKGSR